MSQNKIPDSPKSLFVEEADDNAVRARLVEIEHVSQPGTRSNNAIHIELFDRLKIGRLSRTSDDMPFDGDAEEETVDDGVFLCGRSGKGIKVFHAEREENFPTCKKCAKIATRFLNKGLKIFTISKEGWDKLQEAKIHAHFDPFIHSWKKQLEKQSISLQEAIKICNEEEAIVDFKDKEVRIKFQKSRKTLAGQTFKETVSNFKNKSS